MKESIKKIVKQMTPEEKIAFTTGVNSWETAGCERLGVKPLVFSDGPYGVRREEQDENGNYMLNRNLPSVCYPASVTAASSFDPQLIEAEGEMLGRQCLADGVNILLGPGVNIKRTPLCGRNFEYYSEDPYLASHMAAAYIKGVQRCGVGASLKHYFANNQETSRMSVSVEADERTIREIYLAAFEYAVKEAKPWTVMASYNKVGGVYSTENKKYLEILRQEWGFDGFVVSDWGATHDRVKAIAAGTDLTMPADGQNDGKVATAVKNEALDVAALDAACEHILSVQARAVRENIQFSLEKGHLFARKMAEEGAVLLKNKGILPLNKEKKVAFIGELALKPRISGGGSSHINAYKVESILSAAEKYHVNYARGYDLEKDDPDAALEEEAVHLAEKSDVAVLFVGLPDRYESEGFDRLSLDLPENHNALIEKVAAVQKNIVVVLQNGAPVLMPWLNKVKAVLELYLGGQAVGGAAIRLLYGEVNPSGRLAETFPARMEDTPAYLFGFGENDHVEYREGIFVGYRYYGKKKIAPLFPFGYGLSYTEFAYSDLQLSAKKMEEGEELQASVIVQNIGQYAGSEVVQLYLSATSSSVLHPVRELKGFNKVFLLPGEKRKVTFRLSARDFSYWNTNLHEWMIATGTVAVEICKNAEEVLLSETVEAKGKEIFSEKFTFETKIDVLLKTEKGKVFWSKIVPSLAKCLLAAYGEASKMTEEQAEASLWNAENPLLQTGVNNICNMLQNPAINAAAQTLFDELNKELDLD